MTGMNDASTKKELRIFSNPFRIKAAQTPYQT
jgi:hypothetical protein